MLQTWSVEVKVVLMYLLVTICLSLSLTPFSPLQKRHYETHALYLRVIDDMKWDLSEALGFLSTHNLSWPSEVSFNFLH